MIFVAYGILALLVIGVSIRISYYVDVLDKKTNLSGAFLGGVMLAAVTSLPELFTSISAVVFIQKPDLVMGNILGSNLFNLGVLAAALIVGLRQMDNRKLFSSHKYILVYTLLIYLMVLLASLNLFNLHFIGVNIISWLILIVYIMGVRKLGESQEVVEEPQHTDDNCNLTVRQIMVRFVLLSILLVLSSIAITFVTDMISIKYALGASLAGALFLGIATSLPEFASTFSLVKLNNFDAMFGNILGSNIFNFCILFVADLLYVSGSIYQFSYQSKLLVYFGLLSTIIMGFVIFRKVEFSRESITRNRIKLLTCCILTVTSYFAFLLLSM